MFLFVVYIVIVGGRREGTLRGRMMVVRRKV